MKRDRYALIWMMWMATAALASAGVARADEPAGGVNRKPDVIYVATPEPVVQKMLSMAKVGPGDVVYDLGCGDGRIPIAAVRDFRAKAAVCIDIDPQRIKEARENVKRAGLEDKVEVRHADMFEVDTSPATVVTLYLLERLNVKLRPKLQRELRDGARIVSQSFSMGDWKPAAQAHVAGRPVYLWTNVKKKTDQQARM
jgi:precorrin-6B methylase 2